MAKSPDAFRTISEVADWLGVQAHVLRFWESKFTQVKPVKRAGGRRYYRPADMLLLGGIKKLLHDDGMTIKGVQKMLRENGVAHVSDLSQGLDEQAGEIVANAEDAAVIPLEEPRRRARKRAKKEDQQIDMALEPVAEDDASSPPDQEQPVQESPEAPVLEVAAETSAASEVALLEEPQPDEVTESEPAPAEVKRPRMIEVADVPPDSEIQVSGGALSRLAAVTALSRGQAGAIAPVVQELRDWLERSRDIGPA